MFKFLICAAVLLVSLVNAGPVTKADSCGGSSYLVAAMILGCEGTERCSVPVGQPIDVGISFYSATTTDQIQFQVWFYRPFGSVSPLLDIPLEGVEIEIPYIYTLFQEVTVPDRFVGVEGEFAVVLIDRANDTQIICGEILVSITEAIETS